MTQNAIQTQGVGVVSADQLNAFQQAVPTISRLRTITGLPGMSVFLLGGAAAHDGLQGNFFWNENSTAADDGVNVIVPIGVTLGCWFRDPISIGNYRNFAALPPGQPGMRWFVEDSPVVAAGNFGAAASGGGSHWVPVYWDAETLIWRIG